jgi:hypothetical protein
VERRSDKSADQNGEAGGRAGPGGALARHFYLLRWIGLLLSVTGVATLGF